MYRLLLMISVYSFVDQNAWARPGNDRHLFEGDMAFSKIQGDIVSKAIAKKKDLEVVAKEQFAATTKAFPKWTGGIVPYTFQGLGSQEINAIRQAMAEWERMTCIRFKRRTTQKNYLEFHRGSGCWGHVGMGNGRTQISVGSGCAYRHVMTHEIGHSVGFFHEQSRTDRDSYITILWQNIPAAYKEAFAKYGRDKLDSQGEPYDYGSIMHYPWNAFSTNGRNTVKPKRRVVNQPYKVLSKSDAIQANRMYNCDKTRPVTPPVPKTEKPPVTGPQPVTKCVITIVEETVVVNKQNCYDRNRNCPSWASRGECSRNPSYMRNNCCKSCGSSSCSDKSRNCASWARQGECRRNPAYMLSNCKKSCGQCRTTTKKVKKRVRKCSIVTTKGPISVMPPLPDTTPATPPMPPTLPPSPPPVTDVPPLPTNSTETNTTRVPPVPTPPIPSECKVTRNAGLKNGSISDKALSASTIYSSSFNAAKGRLDGHTGWCSSVLDANQFFKVDLGKLSYIKGISTQGLKSPTPQYISKFYISYSEDDKLWNNVVGQSFWAIKEFDANNKGTDAVMNKIEPPVIARYVKVHPIKWKNYICLRAELHVC